MHAVIEIHEAIQTAVGSAVHAGLAAANAALVGPSHHTSLAVIARSETGYTIGGLTGSTAWRWLYIERLWVNETHRGAGLGSGLIAAAEAEAVSRGCLNGWIDTFNPAALRLYQKLGYVTFGVLEDFPAGHTRTFLRRPLTAGR
jgi:GNAT superfamily N-acetyltransferase